MIRFDEMYLEVFSTLILAKSLSIEFLSDQSLRNINFMLIQRSQSYSFNSYITEITMYVRKLNERKITEYFVFI